MPANQPGWILSATNQIVSAVNRALAMSPGAQKHLKNLAQCVFRIQMKGINHSFYFGVTTITKEQTGLQTQHPAYKVQLIDASEKVDVTLAGSPLNLLKLIGSQNKALLFNSKALELHGDSVRIQQILAFLSAIEIDWDALLAEFIGDVPAHLIGTSLRTGLTWSLNFSRAFIRDAEEYIKYELRLLPDKLRANKQFVAISELAGNVEALSARLDKLEASVTRFDVKLHKP
jgi:ubiquinone biosynthesis protein UbiJ